MAMKTWEISDIDGGNRRTVTLEQYRAELDAGKTAARRYWETQSRDMSLPKDSRAFAAKLAAKL